jgi:hypothetical protein
VNVHRIHILRALLVSVLIPAGAPQSNPDVQALLDRGAQISLRERTVAEARMFAAARGTEAEAKTETGERDVAGRLAADFGLTAGALSQERLESAASWGDLMIAHTLVALATPALTAPQLLTLNQNVGWGQIAAGLGLRLGDAVGGVRAESWIAAGTSRAEAVKRVQALGAAEIRVGSSVAAEAARTDAEALKPGGEPRVSERLSRDFGMRAETLQKQKSDAGAAWGDLMLAHVLAANLRGGPLVSELLRLHSEGEGWGEIAADWNLKLDEVVSAARHESRVSSGEVEPMGKVAEIHAAGSSPGGRR